MSAPSRGTLLRMLVSVALKIAYISGFPRNENIWLVSKYRRKTIRRKKLVPQPTRNQRIIRSKTLEGALVQYNKLKKKGRHPNQIAFSYLIDLASTTDCAVATAIYDEMTLADIEPTPVIYNAILKVYALTNDFAKALSLYRDLRTRLFVPAALTFTLLLQTLVGLAPIQMSDAERVNEVTTICSDMARANLYLSEKTFYNLFYFRPAFRALLQNHFFKRGDTPSAPIVALVEKLFGASEQLTKLATYEALMLLLARNRGNLMEARALRALMKTMGVAPSLEFYNSLVSLHSSIRAGERTNYRPTGTETEFFGMGKELAAIFDEMRANNLKPSAETFYPLIEACAQSGRANDAMGLFNLMLAEVPAIDSAPTDEVMKCHASALHALAQARDLVRAEEIFERVIKMSAELVAFVAVDEELARPAAEKPVNMAYSTMLDLYAKEGRLDRALLLFESLPHSPSVSNYRVLLDALVKARDTAGAEKRFAEMRSLGLKPVASIYNSMVILRGQAGDFEGVEELRAEMRENLVLPDVIFFTTLISVASKRNDLIRALTFWNEMKAAGVEPNRVTYNTLMYLYLKRGDIPNAKVLWDEMHAKGMNPQPIAMFSNSTRQNNFE